FTSDTDDEQKYVHHAVRLFRRDGVAFSGRIHEQITPSLEALGLPWAHLPGFQILHHGYRPSAMAARGKIQRTTELLEKEVRKNPRDPFHWFNLANAYTVAERWPEAEHAARMCLRHMPADAEYGALNYQFLSTALAHQGREMEAIKS